MQMNVDKIYNDFLDKVSAGRNMSREAIDSIGQGRVWSGANALEIGLVDEAGGINAAIESAASLAGVSTYSVKELPVEQDPYMKLMSQLGGDVKMRILRNELGESLKIVNAIKEVSTLSGCRPVFHILLK